MSYGKVGYSEGFMVAGGVSYYGVSKLIFCVGMMNTTTYKQSLNYYREDVTRLNQFSEEPLYFQQDGAPCHRSDESKNHIATIFKKEITWPANSPDLSPIELIWLRVEYEIRKKQYGTLRELREAVIHVWNRIPLKLCQDVISSFYRRVNWTMKKGGLPYFNKLSRERILDEIEKKKQISQGMSLNEIKKIKKERNFVKNVISGPKYDWGTCWNNDEGGEIKRVERITISKANLFKLTSKIRLKLYQAFAEIEQLFEPNSQKHSSLITLREVLLINFISFDPYILHEIFMKTNLFEPIACKDAKKKIEIIINRLENEDISTKFTEGSELGDLEGASEDSEDEVEIKEPPKRKKKEKGPEKVGLFNHFKEKKGRKKKEKGDMLGKKINFKGSDKLFYEEAKRLRVKLTSSTGFKTKFNLSNLDLVEPESQNYHPPKQNEIELDVQTYGSKNILKFAENKLNQIKE